MPTSTLTVRACKPFDFRTTAYSHGWAVLAPFAWDDEAEALSYTLRLEARRGVHLTLRAASGAGEPQIRTDVHHQGKLDKRDREAIEAAVTRMFRANDDLTEFHRLCQSKGPPWHRLPPGAGRLLRAPTLFEDVVKTICTTNIQWSGTKSMVRNLVETFGEPVAGNSARRAFPTADSLAEAGEGQLNSARLGYRGPYIQTLAREVAGGDRDLAALEDPALSTDELRRRLLDIKGVGEYAAHTLLMLLGRYDYLAFDTVLRDFVGKKYFAGERPTRDQVDAIYAHWGAWKFLAYWFDLLAD